MKEWYGEMVKENVACSEVEGTKKEQIHVKKKKIKA